LPWCPLAGTCDAAAGVVEVGVVEVGVVATAAGMVARFVVGLAAAVGCEW
jgi:hypothetical protein